MTQLGFCAITVACVGIIISIFLPQSLLVILKMKKELLPGDEFLAPAVCISHGGGKLIHKLGLEAVAYNISCLFGLGPMPILGEPGHRNMVKSWETRVRDILKLGTPEAPRAIVLITAHWTTQRPSISSAAKHDLYYDYYNFPPETYKIKYDAPGSPLIAKEIHARLQKAGIAADLDDTRGWDHGLFIPLKFIAPEESVPIVQMSVLESEDPEEHYRIGQVLADLRKENIAILGSGFATFHNLRLFPRGTNFPSDLGSKVREWSEVLNQAAMTEDVNERLERLKQWRNFPHAYVMHPQHGAEHFLPLIVTAGAGATSKGKLYGDEFCGEDMFSFYWK